MTTIKLVSLEAFAYRVPITKPIPTSFGVFRDRPMVLVHIRDSDGVEGWGETWSNWPSVGAEHRARLVVDIGARLIGRTFAAPQEAFESLSHDLEILVLQTGEVGPIAQAISGIDIALWDLTARKRTLPLYRALDAPYRDTVPLYATGINPDAPERYAVARRAEGHRAFKLKVGFDNARDLRNLRAMRDALGGDCLIACDANQGLSLEAAVDFSRAAVPIDLQWFEEPLRVDAPASHWRQLANASPIPLAGGENLQGAQFDDAVAQGVLRVLQPDVTKWGGITGNIRVARAAVAAGKRYCPHTFGGGISILSSLHLLAAAGGTGLLEYDCHPNAGRELIIGSLLPVTQGEVPVPQTPGLGATPDMLGLKRYLTWTGNVSRRV